MFKTPLDNVDAPVEPVVVKLVKETAGDVIVIILPVPATVVPPAPANSTAPAAPTGLAEVKDIVVVSALAKA